MRSRINQRLTRLAFPLRSRALDSLADTPEERAILAAALYATAPVDEPRAYVERPFALPTRSRFSNGTYGVLYAANSLATAVRETAYHLARVYADGAAPPMETRRMHLTLRVHGSTDDIRREVDRRVPRAIYDPNDYSASQIYGAKARERVDSIYYDSVRNAQGGRCAGAFSLASVTRARLLGETALAWNGARFIEEHIIQPI
jgi:hypothetical protein